MNAQTKIEAPTGLALLRQPFPDHLISKLPKETKAQAEARKNNKDLIVWKCELCGGMHHKNAVHLDYVGHAALTDRLLECDPNWNWEPLAFDQNGLPAFDGNRGLWIRLTVCGQTRLGYGNADGKQGGDAVKEIIGDALRNAAMRFGAALDLWHKGDLHADDEPASTSQPAPEPAPQEMPDAEWAKLSQLLTATKVPASALIKEYGVKNLRHLNQEQYGNAIKRLNNKLADLARDESNARAAENGFGEMLSDEIPY